jgi:biopolymer transport protein ExbD
LGKRKHVEPTPENRAAEFDMTPMIDVTFQLIVFFLVANDLSRKEIVDLLLPQAVHGAEDQAKEDKRVILNIKKPEDPNNPPKLPVISVRGQVLDLKQLARELQTKADLKREAGPGSPSEVFVLIRADRDTPWQHVQYVMQVCADPKIQLYKLQFATTKSASGRAMTAGDLKK